MRGSAYGTDIECGLEITGLAKSIGGTCITIRSGRVKADWPQFEGVPLDKKHVYYGRSVSVRSGKTWWLRVEGVGEFCLRIGNSIIDCALASEAKVQLVQYWLLHYMLPLFLLMEKRLDFMLHGAAVTVGSGAIAFLAPSGAGKSTLAQYFLQRGHSFLTDDHLAIRREEAFLAVPGIPFIRPYRRVEDLGYPIEEFALQSLPLRRIYLLELTDGFAEIVPFSKTEAAWGLCNNPQFLLPEKIRQYFTFAAHMASAIPTSRLLVPRGLSRLPEAYEKVMEDIGT